MRAGVETLGGKHLSSILNNHFQINNLLNSFIDSRIESLDTLFFVLFSLVLATNGCRQSNLSDIILLFKQFQI